MSNAKSQITKYLDPVFLIQRAKTLRENGHFSNFGEQEIIEKYISTLQIESTSKTVVDIGAGDGIRKSNSYHLFLKGWNGVGIEYGSRNAAKLANAYKYLPDVFACRCEVTPFNVVNLLKVYSVQKNFGILSLDIDGNDYWVLDAVLSEFRPSLIISEYNEKIPPPIKFVVNYSPSRTLRHHFFGYSAAKLADLLAKHNYVLLEIEYNNVFLAPAELRGAATVSIEKAYRTGYLDRADRIEKFRANENMEILHNLSAKKGIEFLNEFYSEQKGEYQIEPVE